MNWPPLDLTVSFHRDWIEVSGNDKTEKYAKVINKLCESQQRQKERIFRPFAGHGVVFPLVSTVL
jgi:hypothetical protein